MLLTSDVTRNSVTEHQRQFSSSRKGYFPVKSVAGTQMEAAEASSQPGEMFRTRSLWGPCCLGSQYEGNGMLWNIMKYPSWNILHDSHTHHTIITPYCFPIGLKVGSQSTRKKPRYHVSSGASSNKTFTTCRQRGETGHAPLQLLRPSRTHEHVQKSQNHGIGLSENGVPNCKWNIINVPKNRHLDILYHVSMVLMW